MFTRQFFFSISKLALILLQTFYLLWPRWQTEKCEFASVTAITVSFLMFYLVWHVDSFKRLWICMFFVVRVFCALPIGSSSLERQSSIEAQSVTNDNSNGTMAADNGTTTASGLSEFPHHFKLGNRSISSSSSLQKRQSSEDAVFDLPKMTLQSTDSQDGPHSFSVDKPVNGTYILLVGISLLCCNY